MASPAVVKTVGEPTDSSPNHPADGAPAWRRNLLTAWDLTRWWSSRCHFVAPLLLPASMSGAGTIHANAQLTSAANFTAAPTLGRTEVVFFFWVNNYCVRQKNVLWSSSLSLPLHDPLREVPGGRRRALQRCSRCWHGEEWDAEASRGGKKGLPARSKQQLGQRRAGRRFSGRQQAQTGIGRAPLHLWAMSAIPDDRVLQRWVSSRTSSHTRGW